MSFKNQNMSGRQETNITTASINIEIIHTPALNASDELIDNDTFHCILKILMLCVFPVISPLGIVGNTFSILILLRQGLHKCSNILLLALAVSDIGYLLSYNNVPRILYELQGNNRFLYSEPVARLLFFLYVFFHFTDYTFGGTGINLPMLITLERLVAVFLPLRFPQIITPFRTWIAVTVLFLNFAAYYAYTSFWYGFAYIFDSSANASVGVIRRTALYERDRAAIPVLSSIYTSTSFQPAFTFIGCILVIVRVKVAANKRDRLSTTRGKSSRVSTTTRMLLAVCGIYVLTCVTASLPAFFPDHVMSYSVTADTPTNTAVVVYHVVNLLGHVNSSCNFIVYVGLNKNFRDSYREIWRFCINRRQKT